MGSWIQSRNEQTICAGQVADGVVSTAHILQLFKVSARGGTSRDEPTSVRPERRADRVDGNCRAGPRHAAVAQSTCRPSPLRRQAGARSASSRTSQPLALVASPGRPQRRAPTSRNDLWCQGRRRASLRGEVSHPQPALLPSWWVQRANTGIADE